MENTSSLRLIQTKLVFEVSSLKKKKHFFIVVGFPLRSTFMVSQLRPRVFVDVKQFQMTEIEN